MSFIKKRSFEYENDHSKICARITGISVLFTLNSWNKLNILKALMHFVILGAGCALMLIRLLRKPRKKIVKLNKSNNYLK